MNFASAGNGTTSHLAGELFKTMAGIDIVHIPYRGGALAITDLIGGQVQMMIEVMPNAYPLAREGRVRGVAVSTSRRVPTAPELPTIDESGLPGFEVSAWDGVLAPAGTPAPVIAKLNAAIRLALEDPEVVEALKARGAQPVPSSPEEFARHIAVNTEKWAKVVKASAQRSTERPAGQSASLRRAAATATAARAHPEQALPARHDEIAVPQAATMNRRAP